MKKGIQTKKQDPDGMYMDGMDSPYLLSSSLLYGNFQNIIVAGLDYCLLSFSNENKVHSLLCIDL